MLTPTIPERKEFLREATASVWSQTMHRWEHLVCLDDEREGCAKTVNKLAAEALSPWLFILADDDLLLPRCLDLLLGAAGEVDVVYGLPLVWGEWQEAFWGQPPDIPSAALIRTGVWRDLHGYDETLTRTEDNDLWRRALEAGKTFRRFEEAPTWLYRFHGQNKSRQA